MARVRGEFIRLGNGPSYGGGGWPNVLEGRPVNNFSVEVTGTALATTSRPLVPTFTRDGGRNDSARGHVRLIADADVIAQVFDPDDADFAAGVAAAANTKSFYIQSGIQEVIPVKAGQRISFITAAAL